MPTPSSQRADARPISFVLHDTANGAAPFSFQMIVRPEELVRSEPTRGIVRQTFGGGGGFADVFGPGLGRLTLSGHTGWRGGEYEDGAELFKRLYLTCWQGWHDARSRAVANNKDPSLVKLIFVDALDDFQWVCMPGQFDLRRSKARPLLSMFNITLTKLSDNVAEQNDGDMNGAGKPTSAIAAAQQKASALQSLKNSISAIVNFVKGLVGTVAAFLGSIVGPIIAFTNMVLGVVQQVVDGINEVTNIARLLTQAATQVMACLTAIMNIPNDIKAALQACAAEWRNCFCLISNVFDGEKTYPDYSAFLGASNCSSTWRGGAVSQFTTSGTSGLATLYPPTGAPTGLTNSQAGAARDLAGMDVVLNPQSAAYCSSRMTQVVNG